MYQQRKISVIIPCYKATKYLGDLYNQFSRQTFKDFKVFLINDGDNEQTEALNELASKDSRFTVIWKENGGASSARNVGIDLVDTEWMMFVDADDSIKETYLESLFRTVDGTDAELGVGGFTEFWEYNGANVEKFIDVQNIETSVPWELAFDKLSKNSVLSFLWNKIYKTQLIHELKLYQDTNIKVIQDIVFNFSFYKHVHSVGIVSDSGYIYRREDGFSLVSCFDDNFEKDRLLVISLEEEMYKSLGKPKDIIDKTIKRKKMIFAYMLLCNLLKKRCPLTSSEKVDRLRKYIYRTEINDIINSYPKEELSGYFVPFRWLVLYSKPSILLDIFSVMAFIRTSSHKKIFTRLFLDV